MRVPSHVLEFDFDVDRDVDVVCVPNNAYIGIHSQFDKKIDGQLVELHSYCVFCNYREQHIRGCISIYTHNSTS